MKRITFFVILLAALILQIVITRFSVIPMDFLLVVLVIYSLYREELSSLFMGTFLGFVQDTLSGHLLGLKGFSKTFIGFTVNKLGKKFVVENLIFQFLIFFLAGYFDRAITLSIRHFMAGEEVYFFTLYSFIGIIINTSVGMIIIEMLNRKQK